MTIHHLVGHDKKTTCVVMDEGGGITRQSCTLCDWTKEGFFWAMTNLNYHEFPFGHACKYAIKPYFWFNINYIIKMYTLGSYRSGQTKHTIVFHPDEGGRVVSIVC